MTIDHIIPRAYGGKTEIGNLVPACKDCNGEKADSLEGAEWRRD